jgi:hypothetical protein
MYLYFIFNVFVCFQQQMRVTRHRVLAKFGLMHMIGTNLSVWLNVLVQETKHEILTFYNPADNSIGVDKQPNHFSCKFTKTTYPFTLITLQNQYYINVCLTFTNFTLN